MSNYLGGYSEFYRETQWDTENSTKKLREKKNLETSICAVCIFCCAFFSTKSCYITIPTFVL